MQKFNITKVVKELSVIYYWARILIHCQFGIFLKLTVSPFFVMQTNHFYRQGQLEPITDTYCAELTPDLCPDQKRTHWKKKLVCDQFLFQRPVNDIGISLNYFNSLITFLLLTGYLKNGFTRVGVNWLNCDCVKRNWLTIFWMLTARIAIVQW